MSISRELMRPTEVSAALADFSSEGWEVEGIELVKEFNFPDYAHAVLFTVAIAQIAESLDHHPDLLLRWGKVGVRTHTHTAGGITMLDCELARRIEALH